MQIPYGVWLTVATETVKVWVVAVKRRQEATCVGRLLILLSKKIVFATVCLFLLPSNVSRTFAAYTRAYRGIQVTFYQITCRLRKLTGKDFHSIGRRRRHGAWWDQPVSVVDKVLYMRLGLLNLQGNMYCTQPCV